MADFRDRIIEFKRVRGRELKKNAKNYRMHSQSQKDTMRAILDELGIVGALMVRQADGGYELLDGEMRSEILDEQEVPILVTDLTEGEVDKFLATYDPVSAMARSNEAKVQEVLSRVTTESADMRRLLTDLGAKKNRSATAEGEDAAPDDGPNHDVPGMGLEPHEHYDYLVVLCRTTQEWNVLCDVLDLKPAPRLGRMGTSRAIRADVLLRALQGADS